MPSPLNIIGRKLFRAYFFSAAFSHILVWLVLIFFGSIYFRWSLSELFAFSVVFILAALLVSLFYSWRWSEPVRRITEKVQRLASRRLARELGPLSEEEIYDFEDGELSELEQAIGKIHRKFRANQELLRTEREESQIFMGSVQEALVTVDKEMNLIYFNSRFATSFLNSEQVNRTIALSEVFRSPEIQEAFAASMSGKFEKRNIQINKPLENSVRYYSLSVNPLKKGEGGGCYGALGVFYDITELKRADQVRIDFVGNASHELRTPLTAIKGYVETLKEDFNAGNFDQAPKFIGVISRNVDRLIELMNDLLSLSALDSGAALKKSVFNPAELTQGIVEELNLISSGKKHLIISRCLVDNLEADLKKVEQVIRNLLANAIKYTQEGGRIEIIWTQPSTDLITLTVKDNGPGIAPEHHDRLFERFYRIDKGRAREHGGTGLGLAIVKHIMQVHGGQVRLRSSVGSGSEFICEFPQKNSPTKLGSSLA